MGFFHCLGCQRIYQVRCACAAFTEVPRCPICSTEEQCAEVCARMEQESHTVGYHENGTHQHHYDVFYSRSKESLLPLNDAEKAIVLDHVAWKLCPYCGVEQTRHKWVMGIDQSDSAMHRARGRNYDSCFECNLYNPRMNRTVFMDKLDALVVDRPISILMCGTCHAAVQCHDRTLETRTNAVELVCKNPNVRVFLLNSNHCRSCPSTRTETVPDPSHCVTLPTLRRTVRSTVETSFTFYFAWVIVCLAVARFLVKPLFT